MRVIFSVLIGMLCIGLVGVEEIVPGIPDPGIATRKKMLEHRVFDHFSIGSKAPIDWFVEVREKNGAKFHFRQEYLSGGAGWDGIKGSWDTVFLHNWNQWVNPDKRKGVWAEILIRDSVKEGIIPWLTIYNLGHSNPAGNMGLPEREASPYNAREVTAMRPYWEQIKLVMQLCDKFKPHPVVVHIEPDEWGHILIPANMDPMAVDVKVGSTGMPELAGMEDNLRGFSHAFLKLRALYAPHNVVLATNPSAWDKNGAMSAASWVRIFKACDAVKWDIAVLETGDRDIGCIPGKGLAPPYDQVDSSGVMFDSLDEQLRYISEFTQGTRLPVYFWQVGVGNFYYRSCNQTDGHFCDMNAQALLEGYPQNNTISRYVKAGCYGFVFSPGQGHQTFCWDRKKDGITNPEPIPGNLGHEAKYADDDGGYLRERAGNYYKSPYPIMAARKLAEKKADKKKEKKKVVKKKVLKPTDEALSRWHGYLKQRAAAVLSEGKRIYFVYSVLKKEVELRSIGKSCELYVPSMKSVMKLDIFKRLKQADALSLALALADKSMPEDHAMLGFFYRCNGEGRKSQNALMKSSAVLREAVAASFK